MAQRDRQRARLPAASRTVAGREHRRVPEGPEPAPRARQLRAPPRRRRRSRRRRAPDAVPDVDVLATSREALEVDGEQVVRRASSRVQERCRRPHVRRPRARDAASTAVVDRRAVAARSRRSAAGSTASRSPSSSPPPASRRCRPTEIAPHLDERFRILTGKRRGRGRTPADAARHRRLVVPAARARRAHRVRPAGDLRRHVRRRRRQCGRERRRHRRLAGARGRRRAWWRSRCSSPRTAPSARPATRCSRRCACSPRDQLDQIDDADRVASASRRSTSRPSPSVRRRRPGLGRPAVVGSARRRPRQRRRRGRVGPRSRRPRSHGARRAHPHRLGHDRPVEPLDHARQHGGPRRSRSWPIGPPEWRTPILALGLVPRAEPGSGRTRARARPSWRCATASCGNRCFRACRT